jgi:mannose-6-phosphate isomerase-like protein (cupin superfamily)
VFVLSGRGIVRGPGGKETPIEPDTVVYIPPHEEHGFFNRGDDVLRFICVIPLPED